MPLRNRVDPYGRLYAVPARGQLMGNRGILHDEDRTIVRTHAHRNWVSCTLSCGDTRRALMAPRCYTELFFLDEATALAAGHRPCATCRRARYRAFTAAWRDVHGGAEEGRSLPQTIDKALHRARIARREKVTHEAQGEALPDGTIFADGDGEASLVWRGRGFAWSFDGYGPGRPLPRGTVTVLTPEPLLAVLGHGYVPELHDTLGDAG